MRNVLFLDVRLLMISLVLVLLASLWYSVAQSVDSFISTERPIAKANLLANIGPDGSKSQGARAGVVIASPSTDNPNYLFTWIRDSLLVFKTIIDQYTTGQDTSLRPLIDDFVTSQSLLQQVTNPSGSVSTGGLGEPKFDIDLSAFTDPWGRPQRDGPALRATAVIAYANFLLGNDNATHVTNTLWPVLKLDLDYVAQSWNQSTFDLWEEISSSSFFTAAVQHRSLREGAVLASRIGQTSVVSGYTTQADNILCFMQSFWNPGGSFVTANTGGGRSGRDANTVLASIHTFDVDAGCDPSTLQPCSDRALANLKAYVDAFRSIYSINSGISSSAAVATGRYAEDVYFGGNPWYLTTLAVAEQLYDAITVWNTQGGLNVTSISQPFFSLFQSNIAVGAYPSSSSTFTSLISSVKNFADGFVAIIARYTPSDGGLAEQYTRDQGTPTSAVDLTWSYAAALTAFAARDGFVPASWGAAGLTVPETCSSGGAGSGGTIPITFNVQATTVFGENIYITGSVDALQNWSPDNAIILNADNYPTWSVTVNLPASTHVEYKYIRKFNGAVTWESDPNRQVTTPSSGSFIQNDVWR